MYISFHFLLLDPSNVGLYLSVSRCVERNCRRCVLSPSGGDGVNYIPDPQADAALLRSPSTSRCAYEDARCAVATVMFAAVCVSFPAGRGGGGLRVDGGHQLGQCAAFSVRTLAATPRILTC